ncbi:MAG: AAA family ATPase [Bacteroidales bacterium]|nr:AAA family ATPase [Bacteroidales bacterium]
MERLIEKSNLKIAQVNTGFRRFVFDDILITKNRLIALAGARGTGKTTLLLQLGKERNYQEVLYVALDDLFFTNNNLYETAAMFQKLGGKLLLLDEVHKYPDWSREIKLIYDDFPDLKIIFTSSSVLDLYRGESDLSRRLLSKNLPELSFREYVRFYEKKELPKLSLQDILNNHQQISLDLFADLKPLRFLYDYYKTGNYPYYEGNKDEYYQKIRNVINLIMDVDIQSTQALDYQHIAKMKKLLFVIASNVPFTPNISKLSEKIGLTRNGIVQSLQLMEKAELIHALTKKGKSISILSKPDKLWLHNTNLYFAVSGGTPDLGSIRETFFLQHLKVGHELSLHEKADFLVNDTFTFEVGGKNKSQGQIKGIPNSYLVKDDLETGSYNTIPLWLFGLLY